MLESGTIMPKMEQEFIIIRMGKCICCNHYYITKAFAKWLKAISLK